MRLIIKVRKNCFSMEFIDFISIAETFTDKFWLQFLIGGLCFLIVFVFQAVALYTIAKREGYGKRWMAFVPILSTYYIGVCAQKNKIYKVDTRKFATVTAIVEGVAILGYLMYFIARSLVSEYIVYDYFYPENYPEMQILMGWDIVGNPSNLNWAKWIALYAYDYILVFFQLAYIILLVFLLTAFYKTYATRRNFMFTVFSVIFPIKGVLFYAVRNNKSVCYEDYVRAEQERQYRMRQQYYSQFNNQNPYNYGYHNQNNGPYDNPYANTNGYNKANQNGNQGNYGKASKPDDPFDEFGETKNSGDPFDELNN